MYKKILILMWLYLALCISTNSHAAQGDIIKTLNLTTGTPMSSLNDIGFDGQFLYTEYSGVIYKFNLSGNLVSSFTWPRNTITGYAFDGKYMWVSEMFGNRDGRIHKIDPNTWAIIKSIDWPNEHPYGITWDGSELWIVGNDRVGIYTLDPSTEIITRKFNAPGNKPYGLAWDGQYLWVADYNNDSGGLDDKIYKIDPNSGQVLDQFEPPSGRSRGLTYNSVDHCLIYAGETSLAYFLRINPPPLKPILLVHGFGGDPAGTWGDMYVMLKAAGFDVYHFDYNFDDAKDKTIEYLASVLSLRVIDILNNTGATQVDIVAHSMGGLLTRTWMVGMESPSFYNYNNQIRKFIMVGTPNYGAAEPPMWIIQLFGLSAVQASQMEFDSSYILDLNTRWQQQGFGVGRLADFLTIAGTRPCGAIPSNGDNDCIVNISSAGLYGIEQRYVNYIHSDVLANLYPGATSLVKVENMDSNHKTYRIVRKFLSSATVLGQKAIGDPAPNIDINLNSDGKVDFLWRYNPTGALAYWLMDGVTITAGGGITTLSTDWQLTGTPDLNSDGKADLLWRHTPTGTIAYWIMSGAAIASTGTMGSVPSDWRIAGTADFNADGKPDILWQHTPTGTVAVWYMNGTALLSQVVVTGVGTDWQIAGTPDLNGDGKPDILWRQTSTGLVAYWLMDGITIQAGGGIATVPSNWHIVGTPDLNADGKPDILWHDSTTGTVSYWYMNGTSISGGGAITTVPTSWDLIAPR